MYAVGLYVIFYTLGIVVRSHSAHGIGLQTCWSFYNHLARHLVNLLFRFQMHGPV